MKFRYVNPLRALAALCLLWQHSIYAQNDADNHRKYWYYKSRLNNDFMKVGTGPGESMPLRTRALYATGPGDNGVDRELTEGDGTALLGQYISVLATEYYLLNQNGQSTSKVKHELFCALNTVNRLDYLAETVYGTTPKMNGFLVKDDVPDYFTGTNAAQNYEHFNYFNYGSPWANPSTNNSSRGFMSQFQAGIHKISSGWLGWTNNNNNKHPMSQDDYHDLLLGLMMVHKLVPQNETDNNAVFSYETGAPTMSLNDEAGNIARRLIDNLREPKDMSGNDCMNNWYSTGWKVKDPVNCNDASSGPNAQAYAYALAEIERIMLTNYSAPLTNLSLSFLNTSPNPFGNGYSGGIGFQNWNAAANTYVPNSYPFTTQNYFDARHFALTTVASCNCAYGTVLNTLSSYITYITQNVPVLNWLGVIINWAIQIIQTIVYYVVPGYYYNTSQSAVNLQSYVPNANADHGPLARKVLWGGAYTGNQNYTFDYLLNVMPCDDSYNYGNASWGHLQWSSTDRIEHPEQVGSSSIYAKGEQSAIDYLLYHNLWYIHKLQQGNSQNVVDLSDVYINKNGGTFTGDVDAFETITCENTQITNINSSTNNYWRAGKTIDLKPGAEFTGTRNYHLYIDHYTCATNTGQYRLAHIDTTGQQDSVVTDVNTLSGVEPFHHVEYPPHPHTLAMQAMASAAPTPPPVDKHFENLITVLPAKSDANTSLGVKNMYTSPNVTKDVVRAYFDMDDDETAFIHVVDLNGRKLVERANLHKSDSGLGISLGDFPSGVYLLKYTSTKGIEKTQKIVKQ